ncbi:hypothetical protein H3Z85_18320 [Chryseobacterium indologenes]|uniref:Uncharacterized protein n=2 Tax=Chryseobacterium indologenes TaxID=253 RepID=A0A4U8VH99_CHRID|nr:MULTISPECIES: T6SS effector amidase Tae4 family protein [Chryseobacterium]ASE61053.1 hypothetical protein CEQ15_05830 [Chryseobacterium indologenes]AYZ35884.1 hypothetical protein EGY07_10040 [Chryseobacterium indologenes]AZB16711.1 hypothetical protein EG352_02435 [Chryseobacterium indologenes]MBF6644665.1 hypothetical protein [Chryseobacterium indologenes]MBU3050646.1 type VI secretion system amidase effector protein Tae4 [Chryseobacterium indologenes]
MNFNNLIPVFLEQQRSFVATSGTRQTKPIKIKRPSWADMIKNYPGTSIKSKKLYDDIGGSFPKYKTDEELLSSYLANSCAIRMSRGLNLSGFKLPKSNKGYGTKGGVMSGDKDVSYWLRVRELSPYIAAHLGKPEIDYTLANLAMPNEYKKRQSLTPAEWNGLKAKKEKLTDEQWKNIRKTKGIIVFDVSGWGDATGHFTLWDQSNLIYPGGADHDTPGNEKYYFSLLYYGWNSKKNELTLIQTNRIRIWELK